MVSSVISTLDSPSDVNFMAMEQLDDFITNLMWLNVEFGLVGLLELEAVWRPIALNWGLTFWSRDLDTWPLFRRKFHDHVIICWFDIEFYGLMTSHFDDKFPIQVTIAHLHMSNRCLKRTFRGGLMMSCKIICPCAFCIWLKGSLAAWGRHFELIFRCFALM